MKNKNPFQVTRYGGSGYYATTAVGQIQHIRQMDIDTLRIAVEFEGTKPSAKKIAESRLRRLERGARQ